MPGETAARWALTAIGTVAAIALVVIAANIRPAPAFTAAGPIGSLQAVAMVNGQLFFGTLKSEDRGELILADVFDVATNAKQNTNEQSTQLIRRMTGSVYGPSDLALPLDKILSTETVGPDSTVAKAMATMKSAAAAPK